MSWLSTINAVHTARLLGHPGSRLGFAMANKLPTARVQSQRPRFRARFQGGVQCVKDGCRLGAAAQDRRLSGGFIHKRPHAARHNR